MDDLVKKAAEEIFGTTPSSIERIEGKGKNNLVYKVLVANEYIILRMNNFEGALELYQKEKWCAEVAKEAGIPTPKILEVGTIDDYTFSFQEFIEGTAGMETPQNFP